MHTNDILYMIFICLHTNAVLKKKIGILTDLSQQKILSRKILGLVSYLRILAELIFRMNYIRSPQASPRVA